MSTKDSSCRKTCPCGVDVSRIFARKSAWAKRKNPRRPRWPDILKCKRGMLSEVKPLLVKVAQMCCAGACNPRGVFSTDHAMRSCC